jgi:hypothetical protein
VAHDFRHCLSSFEHVCVVQVISEASHVRILIGKLVGIRIGVLDPVQLARAQRGVGIGVEAQEWSDLCHALLNRPPDLDAALQREVGGQKGC